VLNGAKRKKLETKSTKDEQPSKKKKPSTTALVSKASISNDITKIKSNSEKRKKSSDIKKVNSSKSRDSKPKIIDTSKTAKKSEDGNSLTLETNTNMSEVSNAVHSVTANLTDNVSSSDNLNIPTTISQNRPRNGMFAYPTSVDLKNFKSIICPLAEPFNKDKTILQQKYSEKLYLQWLYLLDLGNSIYIHGLGSKRKMSSEFANQCLIGEDVLEVELNGNWNSVIQNLLRVLVLNVLDTSVTLSQAQSTQSSSRYQPIQQYVNAKPSATSIVSVLENAAISIVAKARIVTGIFFI
jgi:hypothetical protein